MKGGLGPAGRIGQFFVDSKLTPLIVIAALVLGAFAIYLTPREEEPQISVPMVDIFVGLPGASPLEVENRVAIPLEKRMWEIPGVEYVYSGSMPSVAMVSVRFYVGEEMEPSLVKVYDKLAGSMDASPEGATAPLVKVRTIDDVPVLGMTLWSETYDHFQLRGIAAELKKELSSLPEVSDIRIVGGQRRQLKVLLDAERLAGFGIDPAAVASSLKMQNASAPAGEYEERNREIRVETGSYLASQEDVASLVVGLHQGRPVYLRDVAEVVDGPEEVADYVLFASGPAAGHKEIKPVSGDGMAAAVTVSIAKRKGSDANRVVEKALHRVEELKGRLIPPEVQVTLTRDYGETSAEKAQELLIHLVVAIISVTIVIALFLGWRGGLVVFVSVPVTFAMTLFVYYVFGYTLNRVTLFALIFVTGIVVDDSIIVVENIVRHFSMKKLPPLQAAIHAVNEVGNPTILATLTVIAAVLPMAFVRGLMGPYMAPMPVGAALAMIFSLGVALTIAPWLSFKLLKNEKHEEAEGEAIKKTLIYRAYARTLQPMLVKPWLGMAFIAVTAVLLLASVALFPAGLVAVKMMPFDNKSEIQVVIDMPEGTTLEQTSRVGREMVSYLKTVPEVTDVQMYAGASAPVNFNGLVRHYDLRRASNMADLQVNLVHKSDRKDKSHAFAKRLRPELTAIARNFGGRVKVAEIPPGPPVLATLVAEIYAPSDTERFDVARKVLDIFDSTEGVVDTDWLVEDPRPKRTFRIDRQKAALHGVPAGQIVRTLRLALTGETAGVLHDENATESVPILLRLPRSARSSLEALEMVKVASMSGGLVSLSELVTSEETFEPVTRHRKNLRPVIYVTGDVAGAEESPVYAILTMGEQIEKIELPGGGQVEQLFSAQPESNEAVSLKWDGEWHITYEVFRDLGAAFGAVMILIYMLIIGWFRSFKVPLVMMISIPLSLVGVLPGHWLFGAFFTATSMIGFIALAGIMVRNAVLLIDFVNLSLKEGRTLGEALIEAGAVRFRPILLTAGTVVVGAVVILFDPIFQGLAIALMCGAIASTFLTLIVVPLVHFMVERRNFEQPLPKEWK